MTERRKENEMLSVSEQGDRMMVLGFSGARGGVERQQT